MHERDWRKRKERLDAAAAAVILQDYLDQEPMKKLLGVLVLLVLVAGARCWAFMYMRVNQPFRGYEAAEQFVEIPPGAGSARIGDRLVDAGVVRDRSTYRAALWMSGQARHLKAGEYRFDRR